MQNRSFFNSLYKNAENNLFTIPGEEYRDEEQYRQCCGWIDQGVE
jgi:hypothetical protein